MSKLTFISAHKTTFSVRAMNRVLSISKSWFYQWSRQAPERAARRSKDERLLSHIRRIFKASRRTYGSPRVHQALRDEGILVSKHRVAKLMKINGIRPRKRKKRVPVTTDSRHDYRIAPNLLERNFQASAPDTVWLADITYVPTDEGWLYLAAIKDMATREIVGWSMDDHLKSTLCESVLRMAILHRNPPEGLIHHSDRGVQYASSDYRKMLANRKIKASMSKKGDCYDNAPMESFFGSLKTECVHRHHFKTRKEAKAALFDYIEVFYNRQRLHSSIGFKTPVQAYAEMTARAA
ncbi:MAG: IS3 family transposase [Magnetospiraceae bacterium]